MNFKLDAPDRSHGIKVIEAIPDLPLCRVEGQNGVGKTLALHLLELCTGQQPYATQPDAWRTLCQFLGPATVTVGGLKGDEPSKERHTLEFTFDWRDRADRLPQTVTRDMFDGITLDGQHIEDMDDVRRWLAVIRIAGNETLMETIAGLVAQDRELLRSAMRVAETRRAQADRALSGMLETFPLQPARRLLDLADELGDLERDRTELKSAREELRETVARLEAAQSAHAAVSDVHANASVLDAEIASLREQLNKAQERREQADKALTAARERESTSAEVEKQLLTAQRWFTRRLNALKRAGEAIEKASADLGAPADKAAVACALEQLEVGREREAAERADLADLFALRDLVESVAHALAPAATGGLRARVVAEFDGRLLTAGELLEGVRRRRERLAADAPAVEQLDARLSQLEERERDLRRLQGLLTDRDTKTEELKAAEEALKKIAGNDDASVDTAADRAAALAAAQRVEIELGSALGSAERQRAQLGGGLSLEDLRSRFERSLTEAKTTAAALGDDLRAARGQLVAAEDQLDASAARGEMLATERAEAGRAIEDQTRRLHAESRHARLRGLLGERSPVPGLEHEDLARAWILVHETEERVLERFVRARGALSELTTNITDLVQVIRDRQQSPPELDRVRRLYQKRMRDELSDHEVRAALFDGGELTRVDLAQREVRWRTPGGEPRVRPFEAFSSGERAFAYVQARLASAGQVVANNRVVAVDEFGAFLSHDRLVRLQQAVERQLAAGIVDQVIVVLPFRGVVSEHGGVAARGDQEEAGYVTGPFDPTAIA